MKKYDRKYWILQYIAAILLIIFLIVAPALVEWYFS